MLSTVTTYPLDTISTRLAVQGKGAVTGFRKLTTMKGFLGLYEVGVAGFPGGWGLTSVIRVTVAFCMKSQVHISIWFKRNIVGMHSNIH
jgi:hypothetical protein